MNGLGVKETPFVSGESSICEIATLPSDVIAISPAGLAELLKAAEELVETPEEQFKRELMTYDPEFMTRW